MQLHGNAFYLGILPIKHPPTLPPPAMESMKIQGVRRATRRSAVCAVVACTSFRGLTS